MGPQLIALDRGGERLARLQLHPADRVVSENPRQIGHRWRSTSWFAVLKPAQQGALSQININDDIAQRGDDSLFLDQLVPKFLVGNSGQKERQALGIG